MCPIASTGPDQLAYLTDPAQLPGLLQQLVADLADPAITYLLGGHYYERTNHPRYRHFPAVFALRQGEVANVEVGPDFVAFDTEFVRYAERGELHYPGPWADRFRATIPFAQLYQLCRQVLTPAERAAEEVSYGPETILYYNAAVYQQHPTPAAINQAYAAAPPAGEHPLVAVLTAVEAGPPPITTCLIRLLSRARTDPCCWACSIYKPKPPVTWSLRRTLSPARCSSTPMTGSSG